ncbi:MAG: dienelactone hydrolase family protein [Candidatus Eremiobacteraeota bacterium]|nr:dienelactone hydrolase family protein [Candidatus Eremiobacteraeota bacterium]
MSEIDPTKTTSSELNRKSFVGISAGAAAAVSAMGAARAESAGYGRTHPPLVPEDFPGIVVQRVQLPRSDKAIGAYTASPKDAGAQTPGIVICMHIWGVDTSMRDVARRYAKQGYVAIVPDLYDRFGTPSGDGVSDIGVFRPFAAKLDAKQVDGDVRAAALWIRIAHPSSRIGVTGFCMGGTIALRQTIDNDDVFAADAAFYGQVGFAAKHSTQIHMPICGSYGGRDTSIPTAEVFAFQKVLRVPNDIKVYPEAGHGFFDDQRASYVASAAEDAWIRTLDFFAKFLKR